MENRYVFVVSLHLKETGLDAYPAFFFLQAKYVWTPGLMFVSTEI
jgi:hypothetical protein